MAGVLLAGCTTTSSRPVLGNRECREYCYSKPRIRCPVRLTAVTPGSEIEPSVFLFQVSEDWPSEQELILPAGTWLAAYQPKPTGANLTVKLVRLPNCREWTAAQGVAILSGPDNKGIAYFSKIALPE